MRDYYRILGVQPDATPNEIKEAWIFGRRAFGPEKFADASQRERTAAQVRMQAIHEAYGVLSDPLRRARYDQERTGQNDAGTAAPPPANTVEPTESNSRKKQQDSPKSLLILTKIFSPRGRIGRVSWLVRVHALFLLFLASVLPFVSRQRYGIAVYLVAFVVLLCIFWIQSARRLHDVGWSGWLLLLNFVPYIGGLFLLVVLALVQGSIGANRFGQPPATARATKVTVGVLGGAWVALLLLFAVGVARQSAVNRLHSAANPSPVAAWTPQSSKQSDIDMLSRWLAEHPSLSPSPAQDMNARVQALQGAPEDRELDLPTLAQQARRAVVLIVGYDASGKAIKIGSGFFVSEDGRLVTNWHVVQGVARAHAKLDNGAIYKIEGVLASSSELDLAILKAAAREVQFLSVDATRTPPEPGTRVAVIGSPLALEGSLSEGIVSANRAEEDGNWLQISAPISEGSSGSPVLDRHGRVIGVATLTAKEGQNLNFARSSRDLARFLGEIQADAKPLAFSVPTPRPTLVDEPDYRAAIALNDRNDGAAALELLNNLSRRYPRSATLLFERGRAYFNLGLYDDAFSAYRQYVKVRPSEPAAWHNMALAAFNGNRGGDTGLEYIAGLLGISKNVLKK